MSTKRKVLVADLFCGAGGSSTGARRALESLGLRMSLVAVNHWPVAIETHSKNHPDARHLLTDVFKTKPRDAVPGGRLDLLMASPTCTFYSRARGGKPISREQRFGRMTPTQVLRWLRELDVRCVMIENVPEFREWGPVSRRTQKPIKRKRGVYFRAWLRRIERLGYTVEHRVLNAADYGDATTRERLFVLARKDGRPIFWPTPTHSRSGAVDLFGGGAKRWRAAREVIDWDLEGRSIFRRERPLSEKTLARLYAGIVRFGWPEPYRLALRDYMAEIGCPPEEAEARPSSEAVPFTFQVNQGAGRKRNMRPVSEPLQTVVTRPSLGVASPLVQRTGMHKSNALCVRSADEPIPTVTTDGGLALVEPFLVPQGSNAAPRSVERPVPTLVLPQHGGGICRDAREPLPTVTADGAIGLVEPLLAEYYGNGGCHPTTKPLPTLTTKDRLGLVMPVTHQDASARTRTTEQPLPTVTGANRGELAFAVAAFGEREGQTPRTHSLEAPVPTICARGRVNLAQGKARAWARHGVDILFRMLAPHELARAMGFSDEEGEYEFCGNKTEITRQIGNAVPVRTAGALVAALMGSVARA